MSEDGKNSLPFPTRKMFDWEFAAAFDLEVITRGVDTGDLEVIGVTKGGPFKFTVPAVSTGLVQTNFFGLTDIPTFVSVHSTGFATLHGEIFAAVYLRANRTRIMRLCSGYIDSMAGIGWPTTQVEPSIPNRGNFRSIIGSNPAAGAEVLDTVGANRLWFIKGMRVSFTTDATVATRRVHFGFPIHSGSTTMQIISPETQAASLTRVYHLLPLGAVGATIGDDDIMVPIPPELIMRDGNSIVTLTENLQAGDNFASPVYNVEEFMISTTD